MQVDHLTYFHICNLKKYMYSNYTKSNQWIGQQLDKVSPKIRMTFIQARMRQKQGAESVHRPENGRWSV